MFEYAIFVDYAPAAIVGFMGVICISFFVGISPPNKHIRNIYWRITLQSGKYK